MHIAITQGKTTYISCLVNIQKVVTIKTNKPIIKVIKGISLKYLSSV